MKKKLTRRTVLGTIIGGLAIAPFAMLYFRGRPRSPESEYAKAWKKAVDKASFVAPPRKNVPRNDFPLIFNVKENVNMSSYSAFGSFSGVISNPFDLPPLWFSEQMSHIRTEPITQNSNRVGLVVSKSSWKHLSVDTPDVLFKEAGSFAFIIDEQCLTKVLLDDRHVYDMPKFDLPTPVAALTNAVTFPLPGTNGCRKGFSWTIPAGKSYEYPVTCTVTDVLQQESLDVAEVEVVYDSKEFGKHPLLDLIPDTNEFKPFLDQYSKMEFRYSHSGKLYVDISTGLLLSHDYINAVESREVKSKVETVISSYYANRLVIEA